jgi:hypothetical protein
VRRSRISCRHSVEGPLSSLSHRWISAADQGYAVVVSLDGQLGQATVNVTSVVQPAFNLGPKKVVSYQSAYDSLNPDDEPYCAISGGLALGGLIPNIEVVLIIPLLLKGYTVVVPDVQCQQANLVAGQDAE